MNTEILKEEEYLKLLAQGSEFAFDYIYNKYKKLIAKICYQITGNVEDAKDLTQKVFFELNRKAKKLKDHPNLQGWLCKVAKNISLNHLKTQSKKKDLENHLCYSTDTTDFKFIQVIEAEINLLPEEEREIILRHYFEGASQKEIAEELNINASTFRTRLQKARENLEKNLKIKGVSIVALFFSTLESRAARQKEIALLSAKETFILINKTGGILMKTIATATLCVIGGLLINQLVAQEPNYKSNFTVQEPSKNIIVAAQEPIKKTPALSQKPNKDKPQVTTQTKKSKDTVKKAVQGFKATLSSNKGEIKFGDTVELNLNLKNTTGEDIILYMPTEFHTNTGQNGIEDGTFFNVSDRNDKIIFYEKLQFGGKEPSVMSDSFTKFTKNSSENIKLKLYSTTKGSKKYLTFHRPGSISISIHAIPYKVGSTLRFQLEYENDSKKSQGFSKLSADDNKVKKRISRQSFNSLWTGSLYSNVLEIKLK